MKHVKKVHNFGSSKAQRDSALNNMAKDLIRNEFIRTTVAKARAVKAYVDGFISKAKKENVNKALLVSRLKDEALVNKVLSEFVPRFKDINGGYIEEYKIGFRSGDGAEMIKLMLKGYQPKVKSKLKKVKKEPTNKDVKSSNAVANKSKGGQDDNKKDQVAVTATQRAKSRSGI
jgi:large subunit ribosomal protein L17